MQEPLISRATAHDENINDRRITAICSPQPVWIPLICSYLAGVHNIRHIVIVGLVSGDILHILVCPNIQVPKLSSIRNKVPMNRLRVIETMRMKRCMSLLYLSCLAAGETD